MQADWGSNDAQKQNANEYVTPTTGELVLNTAWVAAESERADQLHNWKHERVLVGEKSDADERHDHDLWYAED
jgi:hypothetical protein